LYDVGAALLFMHSIRAIDSHTEGEPTRVFLDLGALGAARPVHEWLRAWRTADGGWQIPSELLALVGEPRAAPATVGAIVCPSSRPDHAGGVVFFSSAGALGMCGHGTIGLAATLRHRGHLGEGSHKFETPVGSVTVRLAASAVGSAGGGADDGRIEIDNIESYRYRAQVDVNVGGHTVRGDVAWGGNWFFVVDEQRDLDLARLDSQMAHTVAIRSALERDRVTGADGATIDHIALFGPPIGRDADSRNFVLCPNGAYDRSPCGTGTSAKLACLAADKRLAPGQVWRQESVLGSRFDAWYQPAGPSRIAPTIRGRAWITAETTLFVDPDDPARANGWTEMPT